MEARSRQNSHSDQFSDGDFFNALTDEDFGLLQLTKEERAELVNQEGMIPRTLQGRVFSRVFRTIVCDGFEKPTPTHVTCSEAIL